MSFRSRENLNRKPAIKAGLFFKSKSSGIKIGV